MEAAPIRATTRLARRTTPAPRGVRALDTARFCYPRPLRMMRGGAVSLSGGHGARGLGSIVRDPDARETARRSGRRSGCGEDSPRDSGGPARAPRGPRIPCRNRKSACRHPHRARGSRCGGRDAGDGRRSHPPIPRRPGPPPTESQGPAAVLVVGADAAQSGSMTCSMRS